MEWPFIGSEAVASGLLTRHQLATRYVALYRNVYIPRGEKFDAATRARAAWLWSRRTATLVALSAAAIHGSKWIAPKLPAELNQPSQHKAENLVLHHFNLPSDEVVIRRGIPVTTPARTAFDLGRQKNRTLAVIRVDALIQATKLKMTDLDAFIERHRGAPGIVRLREVVALADPGAESPQETRTRLILTRAGLRPSHTQIDVFNRYGEHVRRIDMGWPEWLVGVEYDGPQHWTDPEIRAKDIDTQAELEAMGWRIVRVSSDMVKYRPYSIVERVRAALLAAGRPV